MEFSKIYNRDEFLNFLRRDFLPDDFSQVNEPVVFATKTTYSKQATKLGVCKSLDLIVYEIKHSGKDDPRVGLSKEAFRMLSEEWQSRALVLFVPENNANNYRFSLIEIKLEGDQTSAKVHRKYSNPHRYSYLLGEGIGGYTPNKYLAKGIVANEKDLLDRFSVEVLTKAFYNELSDWYAWAIDSVEFPGEQLMDTDDRRTEHRSKNVIRLLTRLLFVWFLKQKDLIPWQLFDEDYLSANLLKDFAPNMKIGLFKEKRQESRYYRAILQNLFFATLNCPITPQSKEDSRERGFRKSDWYRQGFGEDHLMRYESEFTNAKHFLELVNERVPFLNGGLFDCLDDKQNKTYIDGFSDNLPKPNRLKVPDFLFFGEVEGKGQDISAFYGDKKKKSTDILGLVDILKKYNFTIEENMPFDQEVSLDPELLGKVFENLLASYNPETKTTARKQTGSFYTPREIVQYMVDESLVAHLKRTVGEDLEEEYRKLMRYTDEQVMIEDDKRLAIIQSLQNCKVLDPACGSGAFPVGMLQQMVHILSQLDPQNELWKNLILDVAVKELSSTLKECTTEERDEIQGDINRNFDDSVNRPDYARKLYLIENCIYGVDIQSIAVQISKLRFFISLVVDQKPTKDRNDNFGIRPLPNLEAKFAAANTLIGLNKERNLYNNGDIDKLQAKLVQASHRIFGAKSNKMKNKYKARVQELQAQIAEQLEVLSVVSPKDAKLMREWKMFDQNASSPFFDPEWMFGVSDGFDIVIGNPPYISAPSQIANSILADQRKSIIESKRYATLYQKWDIYIVFIENGLLLLSDKGVLSMIVPYPLTNQTYGLKLRELILTKHNMFEISDLNGTKIFDNATVSNCIPFIQKSEPSGECYISRINEDFKIRRCYSKPYSEIVQDKKTQVWNLTQEKRQTDRYQDMNVLGDYCYISKGMVLNADEKKAKGAFIKEELICLVEDLIHSKKYLEGKDLDRYVIKRIRYLEWGTERCPDKLSRPTFQELYSSPKLLINSLGELKVTVDIDGIYYCEQQVRMAVLWKDLGDVDNKSISSSIKKFSSLSRDKMTRLSRSVNIRFLLGILNSTYAKQLLNNLRGGDYHIVPEHIRNIPIPDIDKSEQQPIIDLVDKILEAKRAAPTANTTALEAQIDQIVYALYNLTEEEIKIIEK